MEILETQELLGPKVLGDWLEWLEMWDRLDLSDR